MNLEQIKKRLRGFSFLVKFHRRALYYRDCFVENFLLVGLWIRSYRPLIWDAKSAVVVSLTSFPNRIDHAWIAIESLLQQDFRPWKVVLVLSEEEFPGRALPRTILRQEKRGLEILWTSKNIGSYKKLLPTLDKYPDVAIVTADDDALYERWRLSKLVEVAQVKPRTVVGHRGRVIPSGSIEKLPYAMWPLAEPLTPPRRCFLIGVGMIYYPPDLLKLDRIRDLGLAMKLCPTADDIWFWAASKEAGLSNFCLGNNRVRSVQRVKKTPALQELNVGLGKNDEQFQAVSEKLGLF